MRDSHVLKRWVTVLLAPKMIQNEAKVRMASTVKAAMLCRKLRQGTLPMKRMTKTETTSMAAVERFCGAMRAKEIKVGMSTEKEIFRVVPSAFCALAVKAVT